MRAALPEKEHERLLSLRAMQVLDTDPEGAYDGLVAAASAIAGTPIALVSLVDEDRQWFKARVGLDATETPRDVAFCAHAILIPQEPLVVNDATTDLRFARNPLVTGDPNIRFYAGFPLRDVAGNGVGTLCVIDRVRRSLDDGQMKLLQGLAEAAESLLRARQLVSDLEVSRRLALLFRRGFDSSVVGMQLVGLDGTFLLVNEAFAAMVGRTPDYLVGQHWRTVTHPEDCESAAFVSEQLAAGAKDSHRELVRYLRPDGGITWGLLNVVPVDFNGAGEMIHFAQVTDVTESIEARLSNELLICELAVVERRFSELSKTEADPFRVK